MTTSNAVIRALRRAGDEPQLTQVLNALFGAAPRAAASFVAALVGRAGLDAAVPEEMSCRAEEVIDDGRLDLRFTANQWDVIVELKLYASYGREQLPRYLRSLDDVPNAYLAAITRDVPFYGESHIDDRRWLGSTRWRELLPDLRRLPIDDDVLAVQWRVFLDVLEEEGSMGFTRPDAALFEAWSSVRRAGAHAEEFLKALQMPLLEALQDVVRRDDATADFYRKQRGRGGPVISKSWNGIIDIPFRVPADGHIGLRAGIFAYNPPTRFYVSPHYGRRLSARRQLLGDDGRAAVAALVEGAFRDYDLHAFYNLDETALRSPSLERDVVDWAHARFAELWESGLLSLQHSLRPPRGADDETGPDDEPLEQ